MKKLHLCQKLKNYFIEDKEKQQLDSLEFLTTSLMISAKIFENEEDVKTFKSHEKICQTKMKVLKKIELDIMNIKEWNIQHFCMYDFSLFIFTQKLFIQNDLVIVEGSSVSLREIIKSKFSVERQDLFNKFERGFFNKSYSNKVGFIGQHQKSKRKILKDFKFYFTNAMRQLLCKFCFRSDIKFLFVILMCVYCKELFFGADYFVFYKFQESGFNLVQR